MRIALGLALIFGMAPTAAFAGQQAQAEPQKKPVCARSSESPVRTQKTVKPECRTTSRPVPPIVDPTPTFIL